MAHKTKTAEHATLSFLAEALSDVLALAADMAGAMSPALAQDPDPVAVAAARQALQNDDRIRQTLSALMTIAQDMADGAPPEHIRQKLKLEAVAAKFSHTMGLACDTENTSENPNKPGDCELF